MFAVRETNLKRYLEFDGAANEVKVHPGPEYGTRFEDNAQLTTQLRKGTEMVELLQIDATDFEIVRVVKV